MKIRIEEHYGEFYAYDDDTYDGAEDSHCPVGCGMTDYAAINDLVEQVVNKLEDYIDDLRTEKHALQEQIKATADDHIRQLNRIALSDLYRSTSTPNGPETDAQEAHGDLGGVPAIPTYPPDPDGLLEPPSEVLTPKTEKLQSFPPAVTISWEEPCDCDDCRCQGRLDDSGYDDKLDYCRYE